MHLLFFWGKNSKLTLLTFERLISVSTGRKWTGENYQSFCPDYFKIRAAFSL